MKKSGTFDITMGAYDGAQISDLVGLLIIDKIKKNLPEISFALYRDDGIAYHPKMRPQGVDRIRKKLHELFGKIGLKITVETMLSKVNFLDITLDLKAQTYEPYSKPNDVPQYVHNESNRPPHVLKNIPLAVN